MTHNHTTAKANLKTLNTRPPRLPTCLRCPPSMISIHCCELVGEGAAIDYTLGWLLVIISEEEKKSYSHYVYRFLRSFELVQFFAMKIIFNINFYASKLYSTCDRKLLARLCTLDNLDRSRRPWNRL